MISLKQFFFVQIFKVINQRRVPKFLTYTYKCKYFGVSTQNVSISKFIVGACMGFF